MKNLGKVALMERCRALREFSGRDTHTEEEIAATFDRVVPLKYLQTYEIDVHTTLTPYNSEHSLGGCVWRVQGGGQDVIRQARDTPGRGVAREHPWSGRPDSKLFVRGKGEGEERDARLVREVGHAVKSKALCLFP